MRAFSVAALAVLIVGSLSAAPSKSFAVGGGEQIYPGGVKHFAIAAHNGPNGPSGHVVFTQQDPSFGDFALSGHVTCVAVSGNTATIGVAIEHGTGTAEGQSAIYINVVDNGDGGSGAPDHFTNSGYVADASACYPPFDFVTPITSGNINVK